MVELEKIAPVHRATNRIFKVPEGYFEGLSLAVQQRIEYDKNTASGNDEQIFFTPKNYFDGLSSKILHRIEQIETESVRLENLARVNVFRVPNGYFENLSKSTLPSISKTKRNVILCVRSCTNFVLLLINISFVQL